MGNLHRAGLWLNPLMSSAVEVRDPANWTMSQPAHVDDTRNVRR